ncbi:MAG: hypothetical protein ACR2HV_00385 [Acidimicrobiales bacterium]
MPRRPDRDHPAVTPLSPLGPGGRPLARWRPATAALSAIALAGAAALLLSDRAPGFLRRISVRIDGGASPASKAASRARPQSDFEIHVVVWAAVAVLIGLTMWSNRSVLVSVVAVFVASLVTEVAQDLVTSTRNLQVPDVVANGFGSMAGLGLVCGLAILMGWSDPPPRARVARNRSGRGITMR